MFNRGRPRPRPSASSAESCSCSDRLAPDAVFEESSAVASAPVDPRDLGRPILHRAASVGILLFGCAALVISLLRLQEPGPASPHPVGDPERRTLVWSDEFEGPAGAPAKAEHWTNEVGGGGWGNNELQFYTGGAANAALDGAGHLVLTARRIDPARTSLECWYGPCAYTSARLVSAHKRTMKYGRVEARVKVPGAGGVWPAFWLLGADLAAAGWPQSGEIDVMEFVGHLPTKILGTIHGPGYSGAQSFGGVYDLGSPVADAWHEVAVEWSPGHIAWEIDGTIYHEATPADVAPNQWVFDHPFFLLVNLAVGGTLGGAVTDDLKQPQAYRLDYVRVYEPSAS